MSTPKKNDSPNLQSTLAAFQRWVHSLSTEELLKAMQVSFSLPKSTMNAATSSSTCPLFSDWRPKQGTAKSSSTGNADLDLLYEMIRLQVPPPTPIHARAIPYMMGSTRNKCSDGRNENERVQRDRVARPRLFQWRERPGNGAAMMDVMPRSKRGRLPASSSSPSCMLSSSSPTTSIIRQYDVLARKFVRPDGERLSLGTTWEQQQADEFVWKNSVFRQVGVNTTRLELVLPPEFSSSTEGDVSSQLFRLLKVASRGRFLTREHASSNRQTLSTLTSSANCAPWLNPVQDWFSLSLYLVSLFEGALWESFHARKQSRSDDSCHLWPGIDSLLNSSEIQSTIRNSLVQALKRDMRELDVSVLMDSLLWSVLIEGDRDACQNCVIRWWEDDSMQPSSTQRLLDSIVTCPITSLNTHVDYLKQAARSAVQEAFANATEAILLQEVDTEMQQQQQLQVQKQRVGKKKKKKKSPPNRQSQKPLVRSASTNASNHPVTFSDPPAVIVEPLAASSDEAATEEEDDNKMQQRRIEFPDNHTSARERNRNIVMAMSILEDVLNNIGEQQEHIDDSPLDEKDSEAADCQEERTCTTERVVSHEDFNASELVEDDKDQCSDAVSLNLEDDPPETQSVSSYKQGASAQSHSTSSPTLSPIMMSLSDLCDPRRDASKMGGFHREQSDSLKMASVRSISSVSALSLPGTSEFRTQPPQLLPSKSHDTVMTPSRGGEEPKEKLTDKLSPLSNRETEEESNIKEERDMYRDMCLTLGAEVAKLKNMLAAQRSATQDPSLDFSPPRTYIYSTMGSFDPGSMPAPFDIAPCAQTMAAMSDTGFRGEHESQASEDDTGRMFMNENSRQISSGATVGGSDVSVDHNSSHQRHPYSSVGVSLTRDAYDPVSLHGMQSRLTRDIQRFLESNNQQLRKQDSRRQLAIVRMTRLVNTVWPRAQVKLYGSFVTGLCLPSSDLDFVICLPAVHKKAIAVAPGVLEGRNAINETSQKLLARTLSAEAWVDTRSMKLIERTAVPVIKVSTKENRGKALQLDITFDSSGHHGLDGVMMMSQVMEELPMLRPLVVVLKQFLSHRGLLTSYTGGLSAHGLFLMVARYLQEQPSSWGDCGSLLMGFLDFYGNNFDPRSTGISVRKRRYFPRQTNPVPHVNATPSQPAWRPLGLSTIPTQLYFRRNSFSDQANADGAHGAAPAVTGLQQYQSPRLGPQLPMNRPTRGPGDHSMPYTLDPLLIEDPLNESNNVGRNAFRIFSVLRAFSDAHRALVASLEWDMQSSGEFHDDGKYPLLKCLLQNEDVVFNDL